MVEIAGNLWRFHDLRCGCWTCPDCNPELTARAEAQIRAGFVPGRTQFLTMTLRGDASPADGPRAISRYFHTFSGRMKRRTPSVQWIGTVELQRRGVPHLHLLVRDGLLEQPWLRKAAVETGFGRQVHVRPAVLDDVGYLAKDLLLEVTSRLPPGVHRVRPSTGWSERLAPLRQAGREWLIINAPPVEAAAHAASLGYRVEVVARRSRC